jgi:cyclic pyranopterin phosphate synthase
MGRLTHLDKKGHARMVDVTERVAVAAGKIFMKPETYQRIMKGTVEKGNVLEVARIGGIMGAKRTDDLIPLCHPLNITSVELLFSPEDKSHSITIEAKAKASGPTGVEMEALTAVSVAALTIYDLCKAIDRDMTISEVKLIYKAGGKSGVYERTSTP